MHSLTHQHMKMIKNNIAMVFPEVMFLMSSANEDQTEGDIAQMGVRLADEINNHIRIGKKARRINTEQHTI